MTAVRFETGYNNTPPKPMSVNDQYDSSRELPSADGAAAAIHPSRRGLWIAIGIAALTIAGIVIGLKLFVDPIPALTDSQLQEAEELWQRAGPASYDMKLEIRGARPGKVRIQVRNGEVTRMSRDGHTPPERTWDTWTVPGQFETLERELVMADDPVHEVQAQAGTQLRVHADFDPQYGYPRRYHRYVSGGGPQVPEVFWRVTEFESK
jgi:hypothetical protein